ncbi:hypothetical protein [Mucilaginibacter kameinonensis]|uniref:hypothetical protein n=1 Tax=Mucilaginibacter kameinonensis TaxID=452286 RepID=UPI0013CEE52F|nr:hypothetical protein [Mucilaginibacter kameinonensis]
MMKTKHKTILLIVIFIVVIAVFAVKLVVDDDRDESKAFRDAVVVNAKVESVLQTRGPAYVHVKYEFNRKTFHADYATYDREALDSLKQCKTVRLLIAKSAPDKYVKYLGIEIP